ncbi:hypothetical protein AVEN_229280-1 [Araneus ventricosus]|uniref:Uncharacterized protein n=1 Tax=Araneus ventricosus TaxID=182803 RepID=A0A4Y2GXP3_ARAVE|nr:hypothetical protein AVEN_229280-1 [Araneus ventricosus]
MNFTVAPRYANSTAPQQNRSSVRKTCQNLSGVEWKATDPDIHRSLWAAGPHNTNLYRNRDNGEISSVLIGCFSSVTYDVINLLSSYLIVVIKVHLKFIL